MADGSGATVNIDSDQTRSGVVTEPDLPQSADIPSHPPANVNEQLPGREDDMPFVDLSDPPLAPTGKRRLNAAQREEWEKYRRFWLNMHAQWEAGHLTQAEFCERNHLNLGTFAKWRHRFKEERVAAGQTLPQRKPRRRRNLQMLTTHEKVDRYDLVEFDVSPARGKPMGNNADQSSYRIELNAECVLQLPNNFDPNKVAQLIRLLQTP